MRINNEILIRNFATTGVMLLISIFYVGIFHGLEILDVKNSLWMTKGDLSIYYICTNYFSADQWRWPIGLNPNFGYGFDSSVVQCAHNLIWASFDKLLVKLNLLDVSSQHFGYIVLFNYFLQTLFAYAIFRTQNIPVVASLIFSALFAAMPFFIIRNSGHIDLGSQYLILAVLFLVIKTNQQYPLGWYAALIFVAVFTHYYLFLMTCGIFYCHYLYFFFFNKHILKNWKLGLFSFLVPIFTLVLFITLSGATGSNLNELGFGHYRADLLTFFDGNGSVFIKDLPSDAGEYEGATYLGLGVIFVFIVALVNLLINVSNKKNISNFVNNTNLLVFIAITFFVFALSNNISIVNFNFKINFSLYSKVGELARASGRFAWVCAYILIIFAISYVAKTLPRKAVSLIAVLAVLLQFVDMANMFAHLARDGKWEVSYQELIDELRTSNVDLLSTIRPGFAQNDPIYTSISYSTSLTGFPFDQYAVARSNGETESKIKATNLRKLTGFAPIELNEVILLSEDSHAKSAAFSGRSVCTFKKLYVVSAEALELKSCAKYSSDFSLNVNTVLNEQLELFLGDGWSKLEADWVWSVQKNATLLLPSSILEGHDEIQFNVKSLKVPNKETNEIIIFCGDLRAEIVKVYNGVEIQSCKIGGQAQNILVTISVDYLVTPKDIGLNGDDRSLGVMLRGVSIS